MRGFLFGFAVFVVFNWCNQHSFGQDSKRGLGSMAKDITNAVNGRWGYDWGYQNSGNLNGEYVPMFWGRFDIATRVNTILGYGNTRYVLGFNEPERADQANMTVTEAIAKWTEIQTGLAGSNIKLVSPAVSDTVEGRAWLANFMSQAQANNLQVDEIAFHWYGTVDPNNPQASANSFLSKVDQYHSTYNRNVWITEFAGIDWNNIHSTPEMNQANATFLKTAIAGLESRSYVTRYAWWNFNDDSRLVERNVHGRWRPTSVGDEYIPTLKAGVFEDLAGRTRGTDTLYLRGGNVINNGAALGDNGLTGIYAMAGLDGSLVASSLGGTSDWGIDPSGSVTVDVNATLRKIGSNTISWRNLDIYNDGLIRLMGTATDTGKLWISGSGTNAVGTGQIRLDSGSHLRLGNSTDTSNLILPYDIQFRGGAITVDGGTVLTGNGVLFAQTVFTVNQGLVYEGTLSGTTGIVKSGAGKMSLNGDQEYTGFTRIDQGRLAVNGRLLGNNVLVNSSGVLEGTGQISSTIVAANGSMVAPGNSVGTLGAAAATFSNGSVLEIELGGQNDYDRLVLTGLLTVNAGAILELKLLNGFSPTYGTEFDVLDFANFSGSFGSISAPSIDGGYWDFSQLQSSGIIQFSAVPEPSTLTLLMLAGLVGLRRNRRKL